MDEGTPLRTMKPPSTRQSFLPGGVLTPRKHNDNVNKENFKSDYQVLKVKVNRLDRQLKDANYELEETREKLRKKEGECVKLFKEKRNLEVTRTSQNTYKNREQRLASLNKMNELSSKVTDLQSKLHRSDCNTKETINKLSAASSELQFEIENISSELEAVTQEKDAFQNQCESLEEALQSSTEEKEAYTTEIKKLQYELCDTKSEKETSSERCSALVMEVEQCMAKEDKAVQQTKILEQKLVRYEEELKRLSEAWNQNSSDMSGAKKTNMKLQDANAMLSSELKKLEMNMKLQLESAQEAAARHKGNADELIEAEMQLREDLTTAHEVVAKMKDELTGANEVVAAKDERINELTSLVYEGEKLQKMNDELSAAVEAIEGELFSAKEAYRSQSKEFNNRIIAMNSDFQELLKVNQAKADQQLSEREAMFKDTLGKHQTKEAILEQQLSDLKEQVVQFNANSAQYHEQIRSLGKQLTQKEKELANKEKEMIHTAAVHEKDVMQLTAARERDISQLNTVKERELHQMAVTKEKEVNQLNAQREKSMQALTEQYQKAASKMEQQHISAIQKHQAEAAAACKEAGDEAEDLKHDLMLREEEAERLGKELGAAKKSFTILENQLHADKDNAVKENNRLKEQLSHLEEHLTEIDEECTEAREGYEVAEKKISQQREKINSLEESAAKTKMLVKEKNAAVAELEAQNKTLMSKYEVQAQGQHQLEAQMREMQQEIKEEKHMMSAKVSELSAKSLEKEHLLVAVEKENTKLEAACAQFADESAEMSAKVDELAKTAETLKKEHTSMKRKLTTAQGKVETQDAKLKEAKKLKDEHRLLVAQKKDSDETTAQLSEDLKALKASHRAVKDELDDVLEKASSLETTVASLEKQNTSLNAEVKRRRERKSTVREDQSHELLAKMGELESELVLKQDEAQELQEREVQLKEEMVQYKKQVKMLRGEKQALAEDNEATHLNTKEELNTLRERVTILEEAEVEATGIVQEQTKQIKKMMQEIADRDEELDTIEDAKEDAENNIKEMIAKMEKLKEKLDHKCSETKGLKTQLKCAVTEANDKIKNLNSENERLEALANQYRTEAEDLARKHEAQERKKQRASIAAIKKNLRDMGEEPHTPC